MPPRLPPGKREVLKNEAFRLSVEEGYSNRAIARELSIDPRTVGNLLREATREVREDTSLIYEKTLRARMKLSDHLGKTLEKQGVSPHAISQLGHAVNSTLDSIDLLTGTRAPTKSQMAVGIRGRVVTNNYTTEMGNQLREGMSRLSDGELRIWQRLFDKVGAESDAEAQGIDVVREVVDGTLSDTGSPYLYELPKPADIVEE